MALITPLAAITLTAAEINAVKAAVGYEDPQGMMTSIINDLQLISTKLARISTYMGATANQTTINTAVTNLA